MLVTAINVREVRRTLQNLPKDTSGMYVEGQNETRETLAKHVLSWITHAYEQLTLKQLQHALVVSYDLGMTKIEPDDLVDEEILTSVCAGLVVDTERSIVRLVRK